MEVCNDRRHEEIIWDGTGQCPLCSEIDEHDKTKQERDDALEALE